MVFLVCFHGVGLLDFPNEGFAHLVEKREESKVSVEGEVAGGKLAFSPLRQNRGTCLFSELGGDPKFGQVWAEESTPSTRLSGNWFLVGVPKDGAFHFLPCRCEGIANEEGGEVFGDFAIGGREKLRHDQYSKTN